MGACRLSVFGLSFWLPKQPTECRPGPRYRFHELYNIKTATDCGFFAEQSLPVAQEDVHATKNKNRCLQIYLKLVHKHLQEPT
jgi:hypothetical protein